MRTRTKVTRERANLNEWPGNTPLRHSFASYHAAEFQNAGTLAAEMDYRDPDVTYRHYRELVRPASAHKYWNIFPAARRHERHAIKRLRISYSLAPLIEKLRARPLDQLLGPSNPVVAEQGTRRALWDARNLRGGRKSVFLH
jgi:hypothetical protein